MNITIHSGDSKITFTAYSSFDKGEETLSHFHIFFEIHFILEGSSIIGNNTSAHIVKKNDIVIVPPHAVHYLRSCEESFSRYVIGVQFSSDMSNADPDYKKLYSALSSLTDITVVNDSCSGLIYEGVRHFNSSELFARHFLTLLLIKAVDAIKTSSNVEKATESYFPEIIIDSYISDITGNPGACMNELSEKLNLSNKQTERLLRKLTGTTLKKLILKQRMNIAMELLETTDLPISEISLRCGYNTYDVFFKAFSAYYNAGPKTFRKNRRAVDSAPRNK